MIDRLSRQQYRAELAMIEHGKKREKKRGNKFGAKRTTVDGITFDSKAEAAFYETLKLRQRAGEVENVEMQCPYALTINGALIATYRADFVFWDVLQGRRRVIDVKGVETPVFKIKRKLMLACHGLEIEVVK
ncbi:DUF1064 domain-containing protein [Allorhizobium sp. BGMRC 0089]|uniref:DUF1064 domain-containing protein n=1 Tax=Allorhizobium sonneratiae TaxID=2934936 RepID=UPI0020335FA0|nr:DUF1064 domain-containing protein [Allorhizobium sonneratiae]MCM2293054.1 DUF1064 domain-containing protein [Allorhizobium sonneratiae]